MLLIRYCWVILKCYLQEHCINVVVVGFYLMDLLSSRLIYHCVCLPCFWEMSLIVQYLHQNIFCWNYAFGTKAQSWPQIWCLGWGVCLKELWWWRWELTALTKVLGNDPGSSPFNHTRLFVWLCSTLLVLWSSIDYQQMCLAEMQHQTVMSMW